MRQWSRCENDHRLIDGNLERFDFEEEKQYNPVAETLGKGNDDELEGNERGEDQNAEEKYVRFMNKAAKSLWTHYRAIMESKNNNEDEGYEDCGGSERKVF